MTDAIIVVTCGLAGAIPIYVGLVNLRWWWRIQRRNNRLGYRRN